MANNLREVCYRIQNLICIKDLEKAKRVCYNSEYVNHPKIQYLLMEIYYIEKNYNKVIEIGANNEFVNDIAIQLKLAQTYLAIGDIAKASAICDRPEYASHIGFMQIKNIIIRKQDNLNKNVPEVTDNSLSKECKFLLYIMSLAKKEENIVEKKKLYNEALILANSNTLRNDPVAIYKKVIILKRLERYEEAYNIAINPIYDNDLGMLIQRVSLLFRLERYEDAMRMALDPRLSKMDNIIHIKDIITTKTGIKEEDLSFKKTIIILLNKLKEKELDIDTINNACISEIAKDILLFAYYEENKYPSIVLKNMYKELLNKYGDNEEYIRIINPLSTKFNSSKIFDVSFYYELLKRSNEVNDLVLKR